MKNKKGFTLIELLAVIAILAILVVLAVPAILDLFNDSKDSAFITQAQSLYKAAEEQYLSSNLTGSGVKIFYSNTAASSSYQNISLQGQSVNYCIKFNDNGEIIFFHVADTNASFKTTGSTKIDITAITKNDTAAFKKGADKEAVASDTGTNICK
jgi:prepilin-type N-terminal cleavage/methylation domain-containing protein